MRAVYNAWYTYGTPPWAGTARSELVRLVEEGVSDIAGGRPHQKIAGENGLKGWPRGWAAYLMTRR